MKIVFSKYVQKSVQEKTSEKDSKFDYFKKKVLEHLASLQDKEHEEVKKAILDAENLQKAGYPVGTIREWKGEKYIKVAPNKWRPKYDSNSRGAKLSIAALKRKADKCTSSEELLQLILENRSRFSNDNGRPLPFVKELSDYVSKLNDDFEAKNTAAQKEKPKAEKKESSKGISKADREEMKYIKKQVDYISDALENLTEKNLTDVGISIESIETSFGRLSENFSGKTALKNIIEEIKQDFVKKLQSKKLKNAVNRDYYLNKYKKSNGEENTNSNEADMSDEELNSSITSNPGNVNKNAFKPLNSATEEKANIGTFRQISDGKFIMVSSKKVREQIKQLLKCVSTDSTRPYITQVY